MNVPLRAIASPYARRLARERGVALASLPGSGPNGRIVAADIPAVAPPARAAYEPAPPLPVEAVVAPAISVPRAIGALAATLDLAPLRALIEASASGLSLDPFLIKAAARAAGSQGEVVRFVVSDGAARIEQAATLAPSEIARRSSEITAGAGGLVLSRLRRDGIRPIAGGLPEGTSLRLLVVASDAAMKAEALLVHDLAAIDETAAADILGDFRDLLENPLRLLV